MTFRKLMPKGGRVLLLLAVLLFMNVMPAYYAQAETIRIATYNIYRFQGFPVKYAQTWFQTHNRTDFFENALNSLNANVICMQEVSDSAMANELATRLGMYCGFTRGSKISPSNGGAILSVYPINEFVSYVSATNASGKSVFSRHFWRATLQVDTNLTIQVYGVHLWPAGIDGEIDKILQVMKSEKEVGVPQFLLGDFNQNAQVLADFKRMTRFWKYGMYDGFVTHGEGVGLTSPAGRLYSRIDYIFVDRTLVNEISSVDVMSTPYTESTAPHFVTASDHMPLVMDCELIVPDSSANYTSGTGADFRFSAGSTDYTMKWIAPGKFNMGLNSSYYQGQPRHRVTILHGFWILEHEVTQELWNSVMGSNPSYFNTDITRPVENVSWDDCQSFLEQLNQTITNRYFRLPTEAEWEYACSAGGTVGSYGTNSPAYAWYDASSSAGTTHPVKGKQPNAWGLYDTLGNVWEWCEDAYVDNAYLMHAETDPVMYSATVGEHTIRGASWQNELWPLNVNYRCGRQSNDKSANIGLRIIAE